MANKIASRGRSKCCLCSFAGFDLHVDANFANAKAVADIDAFQDQRNGLPDLHGDFAGLEHEFLSRNLNALRRGLGASGRDGIACRELGA